MRGQSGRGGSPEGPLAASPSSPPHRAHGRSLQKRPDWLLPLQWPHRGLAWSRTQAVRVMGGLGSPEPACGRGQPQALGRTSRRPEHKSKYEHEHHYFRGVTFMSCTRGAGNSNRVSFIFMYTRVVHRRRRVREGFKIGNKERKGSHISLTPQMRLDIDRRF